MRRKILVLLSIFILSLTGCSTKSTMKENNKNKKATIIKYYSNGGKTAYVKTAYVKSMELRLKLSKVGINYMPWKGRLEDDIILMQKLLKFTKKEVKRYGLNKYQIVSTSGGSRLNSSKDTFYLNYKNSRNGIIEMTKHKLKPAKKTKKIVGKIKTKTSEPTFTVVMGKIQKPKKIKNEDTSLNFTFKGIEGEFALRKELNNLFETEIIRYGIHKFEIIPIDSGTIYKKSNRLYLPVNTLYIDILHFFST